MYLDLKILEMMFGMVFLDLKCTKRFYVQVILILEGSIRSNEQSLR